MKIQVANRAKESEEEESVHLKIEIEEFIVKEESKNTKDRSEKNS